MTALAEVWTNVDSQISFNKDVWEVSILVPDTSYYNRPRVRFTRKVSTGVLEEATTSFSTTEYKVVGNNDTVIAENERELLVDGGNLYIQEEPKRNTYVHVINGGRVHIAENGHCMIRLTDGHVFAENECQVNVSAYGTSSVTAASGICNLYDQADCEAFGHATVRTHDTNTVYASGFATVLAGEGATVYASGYSVVNVGGGTFTVLKGNAVLRVHDASEFVEATSDDPRHEGGRAIVLIEENATVISNDGTRYTSTGISYAPSVKMVTTGDALKAVEELKPHSRPRGNPAFRKSAKTNNIADTIEESV